MPTKVLSIEIGTELAIVMGANAAGKSQSYQMK